MLRVAGVIEREDELLARGIEREPTILAREARDPNLEMVLCLRPEVAVADVRVLARREVRRERDAAQTAIPSRVSDGAEVERDLDVRIRRGWIVRKADELAAALGHVPPRVVARSLKHACRIHEVQVREARDQANLPGRGWWRERLARRVRRPLVEADRRRCVVRIHGSIARIPAVLLSRVAVSATNQRECDQSSMKNHDAPIVSRPRRYGRLGAWSR